MSNLIFLSLLTAYNMGQAFNHSVRSGSGLQSFKGTKKILKTSLNFNFYLIKVLMTGKRRRENDGLEGFKGRENVKKERFTRYFAHILRCQAKT